MSATAAPAPRPAPGLERAEPQLRELMLLAAQARTLPSSTRPLRIRPSGPQLSRLRGRGMEYDESRPYQPGDDIRQLDWRVTARTGRPHTKLFREERERPVFLCVDYRAAMFFATHGVFKAVQAARVASLLAWRAGQHGDRIGGLVFGDRDHREIAPRRGQAAVVRLLKVCADTAAAWRRQPPASAAPGTLAETTARLRRIARPGSMIFLISDFRGCDDAAASDLARLAAHTELALVLIYDRLEAAFPPLGAGGLLSDTRETLYLQSVPARQRERYAARFEAHRENLRQLAREQRMLFGTVDTAADPYLALLRLLST